MGDGPPLGADAADEGEPRHRRLYISQAFKVVVPSLKEKSSGIW
jgi:hypothetical protein